MTEGVYKILYMLFYCPDILCCWCSLASATHNSSPGNTSFSSLFRCNNGKRTHSLVLSCSYAGSTIWVLLRTGELRSRDWRGARHVSWNERGTCSVLLIEDARGNAAGRVGLQKPGGVESGSGEKREESWSEIAKTMPTLCIRSVAATLSGI